MAPLPNNNNIHLLAARDLSDSDYHTYRVVILIVAIVLFIISITGSIYSYRWRTNMQAQRRARGCHCYDDLSPCCSPWWSWGGGRCSCELVKSQQVGTELPTYGQSEQMHMRYGGSAGREGQGK